MIVFLNGSFLPEEEASISIQDRGFLYGDGLFETVRICHGVPFRWHAHWKRLYMGAHYLDIPITFSEKEMRRLLDELLARNQAQDGVLRLTLTRGAGPYGYSPQGAGIPTLLMTLHPAPIEMEDIPSPWRLITSQYRVLREDPFLAYKTANKLVNVMARSEADAEEASDALLLNNHEEVTETTSGNLFWIHKDAVGTPSLGSGLLPGVTRDVVLELCGKLGLTVMERPLSLKELKRADTAFLTLSSYGIVEVSSVDDHVFAGSPIIKRLREAYQRMLRHTPQRAEHVHKPT